MTLALFLKICHTSDALILALVTSNITRSRTKSAEYIWWIFIQSSKYIHDMYVSALCTLLSANISANVQWVWVWMITERSRKVNTELAIVLLKSDFKSYILKSQRQKLNIHPTSHQWVQVSNCKVSKWIATNRSVQQGCQKKLTGEQQSTLKNSLLFVGNFQIKICVIANKISNYGFWPVQ